MKTPRGVDGAKKTDGPLVLWARWVKTGILRRLSKTEGHVFDVIAAHDGVNGSYPSVPLISELTGHDEHRLYAVLGRLVTLGLIERVGGVRRAGSRGHPVVVYRIRKPCAQSKLISDGKPCAESKVIEGKTLRPGAGKPCAQGSENLAPSARGKCIEVDNEVSALRSALASPGDAAPLRAPDSNEGGGRLEHIAPELRAVIERAHAAVVAAKEGAAPVVTPPPGDGASQISPPMETPRPPVPVPRRQPSGRKLCAAETRAHSECGLWALPGSAFCRRHGGQEKPS